MRPPDNPFDFEGALNRIMNCVYPAKYWRQVKCSGCDFTAHWLLCAMHDSGKAGPELKGTVMACLTCMKMGTITIVAEGEI